MTPTPTPEEVKAKLAQIEALKKKLKEATGTPKKPAKKKRRPRFSGTWGCNPQT